jgi:hypothetical protein
MTNSRTHRAWIGAAALLLAAASHLASAQTPACQVTYTQTWVGGNGFGAEIRITNNAAAITNGWTLLFNFPNGQRLQNGWPVSFSQPANSSQVTVASNADWNKSIPSGGSFTVGFNGTFSGANNPPAQFTLNGTVCNGGGTTPPADTTPPTVALTSPTSGQQFASGASVPVSATATDNVGVARVEFRIDGTLVNTDTTSPYGFNTSTLAADSR